MQTIEFATGAAVTMALSDLTRPEVLQVSVRGVPGGFVLDVPDELVGRIASEVRRSDLVAYASAQRFSVETGGVTVNGVRIATDRASQSMIANTDAYLQRSGEATVEFKSETGWVTLTADQVRALAIAVGAHVQACYALENQIDAGIHAVPPTVTTLDQIETSFAALAA